MTNPNTNDQGQAGRTGAGASDATQSQTEGAASTARTTTRETTTDRTSVSEGVKRATGEEGHDSPSEGVSRADGGAQEREQQRRRDRAGY